ncbi:MAG: hypothetical protein E7265_03355 [Lachnospiraceae bacterium]|nr:hypothetical protein [Lachnospiraceae bacterium]
MSKRNLGEKIKLQSYNDMFGVLCAIWTLYGKVCPSGVFLPLDINFSTKRTGIISLRNVKTWVAIIGALIGSLKNK